MSSILLRIVVNGQDRVVSPGATVADLLAELKMQSKFVAVERNRRVVPRGLHGQSILEDGDQLEVVTLVGGG